MKLIKCYIENFGLLHATEFNFSKSLNCCISENGTGKTTLTAFIEAMLYGIGDTRKQSLDENARKKYMPWQGGRFGGSLTIEVGKNKYIIERTFGQKAADDTFRLLDKDSGKVSYDFGEDIGEKLFGIDRDGFLRTVFLSEKNLQGKNDNKSISAKLSDLVGVDGDVGGFDDAIKLLEDKRRFYFKKGNTGEIANVKERILERQRALDGLNKLKEEANARSERLSELNIERDKLTTLETQEKARLEAIHRQKEKSVHEERYITMLETLNSEKSRLEGAEKFFKNGIPSSAQIDLTRDKYIEAKRLKDEAMASKGNEEFINLSEFFIRGTDFVEIADVQRCAELAEEKSREITAINNGFDSRSIEMRSIFSGRIPKKDDIEALKKTRKSDRFLLKILSLIGSLALATVGVILGNTYGYAMLAIGLVTAILSLLFLLKPKKSKELLSFLKDFDLADANDAKNAITEIEKKLLRYEELEKEKNDLLQMLNEEYSSLCMKVFAFIEKFPKTSGDTPLESIKVIKEKYSQYYTLSTAKETTESNKVRLIQRSEELMREVCAFLDSFQTQSQDPFTEIRDMLSTYNYLKSSVAMLNKECDEFAVKYNVTGKNNPEANAEESTIRKAIYDLSERQKALSAEYAIVQRELSVIVDQLDREDEIRMEKDELEQLYKKHQRSLDIIKKTSLYLNQACDNITSKYLGKTKDKFLEYSRLIAGVDGEYSLNTSFELAKTERGESHNIESFSRGTRDLYALGLRLALVDALYDKETPFIILDDPFIALDDEKLERAKSTIKMLGKSKQILYFTCSKSREIV